MVHEIRAILSTRLLPAPDPTALARLDGAMATTDLAAVLRALDPFARLLPAPPPDPDSVLTDRVRENRPRLGVDLVDWEGHPVLVPDPGGPAWTAGLTDPVILRRISGHAVDAVSAEAVARFARGRADARAPVELVVVLAPEPDAVPLRAVVQPAPVESETLSAFTLNDRAVIRLRRFETRWTRARLNTMLGTASAEAPILDLRACSGGDLFEALDTAGLFLATGAPLAYTQARGGQERLYRAPEGGSPWRPAPVLWVGPGTASACEILAGVLHKAGRAHIIGRPTYGKCESQTEVPLSSGQRLRFTNRLVRFVDGTTCSGIGVPQDQQVLFRDLLDSNALLRASPTEVSDPR